MSSAADTEDLEALFDSIAAQSAAERESASKAAATVAEAAPGAAAAAAAAAAVAPDSITPEAVFKRIGLVTRSLHDALRELGYDKKVESAVGSLPDARARLAYVASLTGKAAERVLGAVERGQAQQAAMRKSAEALGGRWALLHAGKLSVDEFKQLAADTHAHFEKLPGETAKVDAELSEIMMAQDFHDLTGQVINRITQVAQSLEDQLVQLLVDVTPPEKRTEAEEGFLNGPVVNAEGRSDVVTSQSQVDDLLESLGF